MFKSNRLRLKYVRRLSVGVFFINGDEMEKKFKKISGLKCSDNAEFVKRLVKN